MTSPDMDVVDLLGDVWRTCRECGVAKPLVDYYKNKECRRGHVTTCIDCEWVRRKQWYKDNIDRRREAARNRGKDRKLEVIERFGNKCSDCQQTFHPAVYQFHHLDSSKKDVNPSAAFKMSRERMEKELANCVMLCANCHMLRHWSESYTNDRLEEENDARELAAAS